MCSSDTMQSLGSKEALDLQQSGLCVMDYKVTT